MLLAEIKDGNGQSLGIIVLAEKTFSTGSKGYFGQGKLQTPAADRLQVQVQAVIIGSKPTNKT